MYGAVWGIFPNFAPGQILIPDIMMGEHSLQPVHTNQHGTCTALIT